MDGQIQPYKVTWTSKELILHHRYPTSRGYVEHPKTNVKCFKSKAKAVAFARTLIKAFKTLNFDTKNAVKVEKLNTED